MHAEISQPQYIYATVMYSEININLFLGYRTTLLQIYFTEHGIASWKDKNELQVADAFEGSGRGLYQGSHYFGMHLNKTKQNYKQCD